VNISVEKVFNIRSIYIYFKKKYNLFKKNIEKLVITQTKNICLC
jgi:hypothetical protein